MRAQTITTIAATVALLAAAAVPAAAQGRGRADDGVPKGYEPPRGMCRVWIGGVPAAQQPAPTDCATAIRRRPENARVVFGEPARDGVDARRDDIRRELQPGEGERRAEPSPSRARRGEADPPRPRAEPRPPVQLPRSRPPDADVEDRLAADVALDLDLLDALYATAPPDGAEPRSATGRAAVRTRAGERGLGRSVAPAERMLAWAVGPDGRALSAWEVERALRDELAYGAAGAAYGGAYPYTTPPGAYPGYGRVDARPGECFDRDFDGRCDALAGGADGCFDRNRDGRCDEAVGYGRGGAYDPRDDGRTRAGAADRRYGNDPRDGDDAGAYGGLCFDRDRDGRCDEPWSADRRIPQTLPEMRAAVGLQRGVASYDVERWLRRSDLQARVADRDGDGVPERVTWLDPQGRVVQSWTDRDGDGIADRVELYRDGLPVQVIGR